MRENDVLQYLSEKAGVAVSIPEYARLREMQGKALKLDRMMKQLMQKMGPEKLKVRQKSMDTYYPLYSGVHAQK